MKNTKQNGIVMIMSVLVISAVLGAAATFASILVSQIQQSRLADQSVQAYYLAESGAERALHQARRRQGIADCCSVIENNCQPCLEDRGFCGQSSPADSIACITKSKGGLTSSLVGDWLVSVSNESETSVNLNPGESFQLDLFNPYYGGDNSEQIGAFSIDSSESATIYGELTNLSWLIDPDGTINCPQSFPISNPTVSRGLVPVGGANNNMTITGLQDTMGSIKVSIRPGCSYVLRLSNNWFGAQALSFNLRVYTDISGPWDQISIPSRLVIDSQANYGNSQQKIRVRTPMRPPLSGLYDFVIFSEEKIIK